LPEDGDAGQGYLTPFSGGALPRPAPQNNASSKGVVELEWVTLPEEGALSSDSQAVLERPEGALPLYLDVYLFLFRNIFIPVVKNVTIKLIEVTSHEN